MSIHKIVITGLFYGQVWQNRLHFNNLDGLMTAADMAAEINTNWVELIRAPLPNDVKINKIEVSDAGSGGPAPHVLTIAKAGGQSADNELSPVIAWVLQFKTGVAGRKGRGRCFIPGVLKGFFTNGLLDQDGVTVWAAALVGLNGRYNSTNGVAGMHLVIRGDGPVPNDFGVEQIILRNTQGVQRRRNIGVGV